MEYEIRQVNPSSNGKTIVEESKVRRQVSGCHKKFFLSPIFTPSPFVCYLFPRRTWQCIWTNYMRRNRNIFILNLTNFFLRVGVRGRIWWSLFVHPSLGFPCWNIISLQLFSFGKFSSGLVKLGRAGQGQGGAKVCNQLPTFTTFVTFFITHFSFHILFLYGSTY